MISFSDFRGYFCKRGKLRKGETPVEQELDQEEFLRQQQLNKAQQFTFIE
jgi:hypothetical protein